MNPELLAWRKFPEPDGTNYFKTDLVNRSKVIELFDYCQILEAAIWAQGWRFLFEHYGLKGILEIDKESGWLDDTDLGEWITSIYFQSLTAGFDPQKMDFGKYSVESGLFIHEAGLERKIDWAEIYDLKFSIEGFQ